MIVSVKQKLNNVKLIIRIYIECERARESKTKKK